MERRPVLLARHFRGGFPTTSGAIGATSLLAATLAFVAYIRCSHEPEPVTGVADAGNIPTNEAPSSLPFATNVDAMTPDANEPADWSLPEAFFEAAVVTPLSEAELGKFATPRALAALLGDAHCGSKPTCDAVRAFVGTPEHTKVEIMTSERWTLPPKDRMAVASPDLSEAERERVHTLGHVVVLRIGGTGPSAPDHLVSRAGFGVAAALAEAVRGFVHDEVRQRIESPAVARRRCITANLGERFDVTSQITLQALPQSTAPTPSFRLTTHGLKRFGAPDLEVVCSEEELSQAGHMVNALAHALAHARSTKRTVIFSPSEGQDLTVTLVHAPIAEAQPINVVLRATLGAPQAAAAGRGSWTDAASDDDRKRARQTLLNASKAGGVRGLLVRADFPTDAGVEAMWVELSSLEGETCTGTLKSHPTMATHLKEGATVSIPTGSIDKVVGASAQE